MENVLRNDNSNEKKKKFSSLHLMVIGNRVLNLSNEIHEYYFAASLSFKKKVKLIQTHYLIASVMNKNASR